MKWNGSGFSPFCVEADANCKDICRNSSKEPQVTNKEPGAGSSCHAENARQLVGTARDLEKRRRKEREFHVHVSSL